MVSTGYVGFRCPLTMKIRIFMLGHIDRDRDTVCVCCVDFTRSLLFFIYLFYRSDSFEGLQYVSTFLIVKHEIEIGTAHYKLRPNSFQIKKKKANPFRRYIIDSAFIVHTFSFWLPTPIKQVLFVWLLVFLVCCLSVCVAAFYLYGLASWLVVAFQFGIIFQFHMYARLSLSSFVRSVRFEFIDMRHFYTYFFFIRTYKSILPT